MASVDGADNPPRFLYQVAPPPHRRLQRSSDPEERLMGHVMEALAVAGAAGDAGAGDAEERLEVMKLMLLLG